jgi:GGDEF domain-containing protein
MQVLTNLVGNAIKFTRQGGITVSVSSTDHEIECSVSDTGVGIAEEDMPKLFDKFTQFGRAHGAGEKGTGLGLAIVKSIVELHGGRVRAGSKLGVGSTFTFVIPRHSEDLVLRSRIDERIAEARRAQAPFSVFLFHLAFDEAGGDAESVRRTVRQGLLRLLQSKALARDTDVVHQRGDRELALVADSGPEHAASIVGRWMQEIEGCFSGDGTGGPVVRASCGFACYPRDGGSVEALLAAAEGSMRSGPDAARPEGGSAAPAPRS